MKWDYQFVDVSLIGPGAFDLNSKLNDMGGWGWEAVGIASEPNRIRVLMKRPSVEPTKNKQIQVGQATYDAG